MPTSADERRSAKPLSALPHRPDSCAQIVPSRHAVERQDREEDSIVWRTSTIIAATIPSASDSRQSAVPLPPPLDDQDPAADEKKRKDVAERAVEDAVVKQVRAPRDADQRRQHDAVAEMAPENSSATRPGRRSDRRCPPHLPHARRNSENPSRGRFDHSDKRSPTAKNGAIRMAVPMGWRSTHSPVVGHRRRPVNPGYFSRTSRGRGPPS